MAKGVEAGVAGRAGYFANAVSGIAEQLLGLGPFGVWGAPVREEGLLASRSFRDPVRAQSRGFGSGGENGLGKLVARRRHIVPTLAHRALGDGPSHRRQPRSPKNESWQPPPIPPSQSQTPAFGQERR